MDGLEDQASAALEGIIDQFYTNETVQVKHSSRDLVILGVKQALMEKNPDIVAKKLVFRSGISMAGLDWLEEALLSSSSPCQIQELEFVCLQNLEAVMRAFHICKAAGIRHLSLKTLLTTTRSIRHGVSETIRSGLLLGQLNNNATGDGGDGDYDTSNNQWTLDSLEIINYPIGVRGLQTITDCSPVATAGLKTLRLVDCNLRSDSANYISKIVQFGSKLQVLDLSHNRQFLGNMFTCGMTIKTLIQKGLKYNVTLLQLHLNGIDGTINRSILDRQLDVNRILHMYTKSPKDDGDDTAAVAAEEKEKKNPLNIPPVIWCSLLARVSVKPAAMYYFLQQNISILIV